MTGPRGGTTAWRVVTRRRIYRNPWISVREDVMRRPDGSRGTYGIIDVADAVSIVAAGGGRLCLVRQFRPSWGRRIWEVPCGGIHRGESPLAAAKRELLEEAGITAGRWHRAGIVQSNDPMVNRFHVFLAQNLSFGRHRREQSESDMESRMWTLDEFRRAVLSGAIRDDMTIACVFKCLLLGGIMDL